MKKDHALYLLSALSGAAVWYLISEATGKKEAWDSGLYFSAGLPAVYGISLVFGFIEPSRSWRWALLPFAGQLVWMLIAQGVGNLLPLGVILFGVLSLPGMLAARLGAFARKALNK